MNNLQKLFIIFSFTIFLYAQNYPSVFSQLGTPLYQEVEAFEALSKLHVFKTQSKAIEVYKQTSDTLMQEGFLADESKDKKEIKAYLKKLRNLQKQHDKIQKFYKQQLYKSINDKNNTAFNELMSQPLAFVSSDARLKKQAVAYYKKHKQKNIAYLEDLSKDVALDEASYAYLDKMFQTHQAKLKVQRRTSLDTFVPQAELKTPVQVVSVRTKTGFALYLENNAYHDVTVKLEATKLENLNASENLPYINSYPSRSRSLMFHLSVIDPSLKSAFKTHYSTIVGRLNPGYDRDYLYALPFRRGTSHMLTQGFHGKYTHKGYSAYALDFDMNIGSHVHAMRDGIVTGIESKHTEHGYSPEYASKANYIIIQHKDGTMAMYGHLDTGGVRVRLGQRVYKHQFIGLSGNTGYSSGPHLHVHITAITDLNKGASSVPFSFLAKRGKVDKAKPEYIYTAK